MSGISKPYSRKYVRGRSRSTKGSLLENRNESNVSPWDYIPVKRLPMKGLPPEDLDSVPKHLKSKITGRIWPVNPKPLKKASSKNSGKIQKSSRQTVARKSLAMMRPPVTSPITKEPHWWKFGTEQAVSPGVHKDLKKSINELVGLLHIMQSCELFAGAAK